MQHERAADLRYAIVDEPRPSRFSRLAMPPFVGFISLMLFSPLGAVLFIVNAIALRSRTLWWEIGFAIAAVALKDGLRVAMALYWPRDGAYASLYSYVLVIPLVLGLWCGYRVYVLQTPAYQIRKYLRETEGGT